MVYDLIYTVTFNPAVDYVIRLGEMITGGVNRSDGEEIFFGGKGINVSLVLAELGIRSKALGFTAGFTGRAIEQGISERGVETDLIRLDDGFSRINVKIKTRGCETELNGRGPAIPEAALGQLFSKLDALQSGDTLVLAGSIPNSLPSDIYEKTAARLDGKNIRLVVDAAKDLLLNVLKYKPFLVKPNNFELGEMFGAELKTDAEIIEYAKRLHEMGAVNVLVSMAENGSILIDEFGEVHRCGVCKGTVRNSVGAGDSMVAGFLAGCEKGYGHALKLGTAAGGATAFSDGLAEKEKIFELLEQLEDEVILIKKQ